jgi:hypothetical protein
VKDLDELIEAVEEQVRFCANCQPWEGGEPIWVQGAQTSIEDLLEAVDVPEDLKDEVVSRIQCRNCGSEVGRYDEVGTLHGFEVEHERRIEDAERKYADRLYKFSHYLRSYPYLGAEHQVGRELLKLVKLFPKIGLGKQTWYRARVVLDGNMPNDLGPPEPDLVAIPEGRFNHFGQAHWYLASTDVAAAMECSRCGQRVVAVQGWHIDRLANVLDLRAWLADGDSIQDGAERTAEVPLLGLALIFGDFTTMSPQAQAGWKPEYFVPRFIADAAKEAGFEGIIYKSERHMSENLVVFDRKSPFSKVEEPRLLLIPEQIDAVRIRLSMYGRSFGTSPARRPLS